MMEKAIGIARNGIANFFISPFWLPPTIVNLSRMTYAAVGEEAVGRAQALAKSFNIRHQDIKVEVQEYIGYKYTPNVCLDQNQLLYTVVLPAFRMQGTEAHTSAGCSPRCTPCSCAHAHVISGGGSGAGKVL